MDRESVKSAIREIAEVQLTERNFELVDIVYRYEGSNLFLRILADRPEGGITLEECAAINRDVSRILDEKNLVQQRYILEVSSPGLDRPLNTKNDFSRCMNRRVRIFLREPVNERLEFEGEIKSVGEQSVFIDSRETVIEIPFVKISKAKQVIDDNL